MTDLFDNAVEQQQSLPRRHKDMIAMYGEMPGERCGDCVHFISISYANTYHKCDLTRMTHGAATDWRVNWPACGRWEAR